jgi:Glycosyl hydrolases family 35
MTASRRSRRTGFVATLGVLAIAIFAGGAARSVSKASTLPYSQEKPSALPQNSPNGHGARGIEIVMHGGYPELRVNGEPFFIHSAAFFYYRVPRDLWEVSLERYRALGINTIDLYIPWNWHELADGEFDFDGHTNSRRDLRGLLKLLANKNLKLIARPGPLILNEWRFGGYPEWLLQRADFQAAMPAEFRMDELDLLEGRYPPLAGLNSRDAEAAASAWLANPLHMDYSRKWLEAVGRELAPYAASPPADSVGAGATAALATLAATAPPNLPLLFVQLDDDVANGRANRAGPAVWRYLESLREALRAGGLGVPVFINPTDMRVAAAGAALDNPIGVMGQWYLHPNSDVHADKELKLSAEDASTIEFFTEELKTQPGFPPSLIEYQAGWYAPGDDDRPVESAAENTLDSSRLFLAHGLHGISYFPLQDSVVPAGWSVPWANQSYLWNAALDPNGHSRRRADAIARNGEILMRWGPQLAAAHKRADFGVIYPLGAYDQSSLTAEDIRRVSEGVQKIERLAQLDHLSSELLDPEYQPVEQLQRDAMILLPVFDRTPDATAGSAAGGDSTPLQLSEKSQRALVEYVRSGGTLFVFPKRPAGEVLAELWKEAPAANPEAGDIVSVRWAFGSGHVIESSKDLFSWINLKQSFVENRQAESSDWDLRAIRKILTQAGVHPAITVLGDPVQASSLVITELVSNEGTGKLGARTSGHGWLSVTNLNADDSIDASLLLLTPAASSVTETPERISLDITVPPRESLLVPLGLSLCLDEAPATATASPPSCSDEVLISGAELVSAARDGKRLELTFYSPARADIRLRLEQAPSHVEVEDTSPETKWSQERHELSLATSRGAAPGYLRKLKVQLPYVPHVPSVTRESDRGRGWSEMSVVNALRLPLGPITNLGTSPPLIVIDDPRAARVTFEASNTDRDFHGDIDVNLSGAYKGSANLRILAGQIAVDTAKLKPPTSDSSRGAGPPPLDENGLLHGSIEAREGHDRKQSSIFYVPLRTDATTAYRYDFDDDGALEWVLENASLRLIVSPASGGRALALVEKSLGFDVLSSVGGLRDGFSFTPNPPGISPERERGRYGLFNRAYEAAWVPDDKNTAMTLSYHAADVFPYGAKIEKRVEIEGDSLSVSYRVSLDSPDAASAGPHAAAAAVPADQAQSFVATQSVPALDERGRLTKFCWSAAPPKDAPAPSAKDSEGATEHCDDFAPGGAAIEIPADANHLEVRTAGRPGLAIDWDSGRLTIAPKRYSALLELRSAALKPGDETRATLRFRILTSE